MNIFYYQLVVNNIYVALEFIRNNEKCRRSSSYLNSANNISRPMLR